MARANKPGNRRNGAGGTRRKLLKTKASGRNSKRIVEVPVDPAVLAQLKQYEEGVRYFQQQKFHRAVQVFEKVAGGPGNELADRARMHLRMCAQRIARTPVKNLRGPEDHYHQGIAMMNLGRWDEARENLEKAKKLAAKADYIHYALAALDCLTGEADAALQKLKVAIELRPENRYHARNDEDFAFLAEDPRFTELLYPERDGTSG